MKHLYLIQLAALALICSACDEEVRIETYSDSHSPMERDFADVVVPSNIAPLNFYTTSRPEQQALILSTGTTSFTCIMKDGRVTPKRSQWRSLISDALNRTISIVHCVKDDGHWIAYHPFLLYVAPTSIDKFLTYRMIPPGYEKWYEMKLCQRDLETGEESIIDENRTTGHNCINCHSFRQNDVKSMSLHTRGSIHGTMLITDGEFTKINPADLGLDCSLVYPYWHPSGRYIAYSTNDTKQLFHTTDPNAIEVFDLKSDIVVYDVASNRLIDAPVVAAENAWETYPCFSPDGGKLYFCSAGAEEMPINYKKVKYSICAVSFDPKLGRIGESVDTIINAANMGKSFVFPRLSPDGHTMLVTASDYGCFPIWHNDADIFSINLAYATDTTKCVTDAVKRCDALNSEWTESYHSWSSNGHWIVFSSRRDNGLYTTPYIAYFDTKGVAHKPFRLPQNTDDYYDKCLYSFNIPEFSVNKVQFNSREFAKALKQ